MSDHLVFLVGDQAPRLRRRDAAQLARELERLTVIDGQPLTGANAAAAVIRAALEQQKDVVELEERELRAVYVVVDRLDVPLPEDLRQLRAALASALEIPST